MSYQIPGPKTGFLPSEKGTRPSEVPGQKGSGFREKGIIDSNGNYWVRSKESHGSHRSGFPEEKHWHVYDKKGKEYDNVHDDSHVRPGTADGTIKIPNPQSQQSNIGEVAVVAAKTTTVVVALYVTYTVVKWGIAAILAGPTGGGSLVVAGVTP